MVQRGASSEVERVPLPAPDAAHGSLPLSPYAWAALGVLASAGIVVTLLRLRKRNARRGVQSRVEYADTAPPVTRATPLREQDALLAGDMDELVERLSARLESQIERLERTMAEADKRIEALTALRVEAAEPVMPRHTMREVKRASVSRTQPPPSEHTDEPGQAEHPDALTRTIYGLADEGLPPVEIARRLSQHIGAVELILALRRVS
jgi:hypothetical protein